MTNHRYILEPYKGMNTRYDCPGCGKRKTFTRYIDTTTGNHLHPTAGRCNREVNCGYHLSPKQYFENNKTFPTSGRSSVSSFQTLRRKETETIQKPVSFIPFEAVKKSLQHYNENDFVKFLCWLFGSEITTGLIERYFIGTSKHRRGVIFWQIDISGRVRTGKIMLYDSVTGHRVKEKPRWVHYELKIANFNLCLFGEHLLKGNSKPVAVVESEKTALIASVYLPDFIWLASGSLSHLSTERCKVLQGRRVTLFPDLGGFEKWNEKAKEITKQFPGTRVSVSDLLERKATQEERQRGCDIADYLIRFDHRSLQQEKSPEPQQTIEPPQRKETVRESRTEQMQATKRLNVEIDEWQTMTKIFRLKEFFESCTLPASPVRLKPGETITDVALFVASHMEAVRVNRRNPSFLPHLERLLLLKDLIESENQRIESGQKVKTAHLQLQLSSQRSEVTVETS